MKLKPMVLGALLVAVFAAGFLVGRHQRPVPDPHLTASADRIQSVIGWGKEQLAEAAATRQRAATALDYAKAHRGAHHEATPLPPAPTAAATTRDTLTWALRTIDVYTTIVGNLQQDTLRLGRVADSAITAADSFKVADSISTKTADSLLIELGSAETDLRAAADSIGRLRAAVRRAYGTRVGGGVNLAAVQQTFTSVAGVAVQSRKRVLFLDIEARAIGGYGFGGDAVKREVRGGLGGAAQVTVTF